MKKRLNQKGFTLVEILIVVVILAILASLILPRFLAQPERAVLAEAAQTLGSLRRAQQQRIDLGAGVLAADPLALADFQGLGMGDLNANANGRFSYGCDATSCTAFRLDPATRARTANTIQLYYVAVAGANNTADGSFVCTGYAAVVPAPAYNDRGCA